MININNLDTQIGKQLRKLELVYPNEEIGSKIIREVALNYMADMRIRIQQRGENSSGSQIGQYSKKPIYVSIDEMPKKLQPEGKEYKGKRRSTFASGKRAGKPHSSRFFEGGYDQYKTELGRNTLGSVNLTLTGQMFNQMQLLPVPQGWGIGWSGKELLERAEILEKKYKVFEPTNQERDDAVQLARKLTQNALSR